jgi:hypothetical protein
VKGGRREFCIDDLHAFGHGLYERRRELRLGVLFRIDQCEALTIYRPAGQGQQDS